MIMRQSLFFFSLFSVGLLEAQAAPITTDTALPVAEDEFISRSQVVIANASSVENNLHTDYRTIVWANVLGYGLSADWAVFAVVPLVFARVEPPVGSATEINGLGNVRLFGRYTAFKKNGTGYTFRVTPFAGIDVPTNTRGLGSRTTDPFLGAVTTYLNNDFEVDFSTRYQFNRTDSKARVDPGDSLNIDASLQYRILPRHLGSGKPGFLFAVAEANIAHSTPTRTSTGIDIQPAQTTLFLSPGLQYVTGHYVVEASLQVPVYRSAEPNTVRPSLSALASVRIPF